MLNKLTNDFLDALADLINNSGLPPVVVRLALENARDQVAGIERQAVSDEIRMDEQKKNENKEG